MGTDAGKPVKPLASNTLGVIGDATSQIDAAAQAAGVSSLALAAPIAREINKTNVGDYNYDGFAPVINSVKNYVVTYGGGSLGSETAPLTNEDYVGDLNYVRSNNITNLSGFSGDVSRLIYPVLNDLGPAKIQLGTAMEAVQYYANNTSLFIGNDPLSLQKYVNNTPQLVADLIDPSTSMATSIDLQAVIAQQADAWGSAHVADWSNYTDDQKAEFTTSFSTLGQQKYDDIYSDYLQDGGTAGQYSPNLQTTDGATYLSSALPDGTTNVDRLQDELQDAAEDPGANAGDLSDPTLYSPGTFSTLASLGDTLSTSSGAVEVDQNSGGVVGFLTTSGQNVNAATEGWTALADLSGGNTISDGTAPGTTLIGGTDSIVKEVNATSLVDLEGSGAETSLANGGAANIASGQTGETITGSGSTISTNGLTASSITGSNDTVKLDAGGGDVTNISGSNDTITGDSGTDVVSLSGSGTSATVSGGGAVDLTSSTENLTLGSSDSIVTASVSLTGETVTGSHDTIDFGSHDTGEHVDGTDDTINLTKQGDDAVTVDGSGFDVTGDTVNNAVALAGADTSAVVHGGAWIGVDGNDDTLTATGTASISVARRLGDVTIYASDASIYLGNYASATIWGANDTISHGTGAEISGSYYGTGGGGARSYGNSGSNYGGGGSDGGGGSFSSDDFAHNAAALKKKPSQAHTSAATSAETAAAGGSVASSSTLASSTSTSSTASTASTTHTSTLTQSDMAEVRARRAAQGTSEAGAATTPKFEGPKWAAAQTAAAGASAAPTITWSFATGPAGANDPFSSYLSSAYKATIEKAFAAWAKASGLTFEEVPDSAASDIRIGWGDLGTSTTGVLGTTTLSDANGAITSAVIRLEDPSLATMKTGAKGQERYAGTGATLYQVALHEIGHALGLADDSDPNSVMFASSSKANRKLDATDVKGIQSLYGSTLTQAQTSTISPTTSSAAAGVNQLVQAMSTFDPPQAAPSLTALAAATTATTPTLATPSSR